MRGNFDDFWPGPLGLFRFSVKNLAQHGGATYLIGNQNVFLQTRIPSNRTPMQLDPSGVMARLARALGLPHVAPGAESGLVKVMPDNLRDTLANFDEARELSPDF